VILGIAIGALPDICGDLIAHSRRWQDMIARIKTVRTQALQLWLRPTTNELGWPDLGHPIMSFTYSNTDLPNALNAWGDMSHLIPREDWTSKHYPLSLAYFCSAMPDIPPLTPGDDPGAASTRQADADERVFKLAAQLLDRHLKILWPACMDKAAQGSFKWNCLIDARPAGQGGEQRLRSQPRRVRQPVPCRRLGRQRP
jgi:hypothetical protein